MNQVLWYATRGAGAVTTLMLTGVVMLGILTAVRWRSESWPRFLSAELHRSLALLSLVFLGVHVVTAVIDPFTSLGWMTAAIPFWSPYRRLWLGLGVIAFDLILALVVTSLVRHLLGHRAWRSVHWLAYAAWPVAILHGLGTGTDAFSVWMLAIDAACVGAVGLAIAWRLRVASSTGGVPWATSSAADERRWRA
jgi:sulfoxide reductase heme-binding subunit YedZ